jgi:hypothetical protein
VDQSEAGGERLTACRDPPKKNRLAQLPVEGAIYAGDIIAALTNSKRLAVLLHDITRQPAATHIVSIRLGMKQFVNTAYEIISTIVERHFKDIRLN